MTEAEVIELARALPGGAVQTADEASRAPEMAWGDPEDMPEARVHPFATLVVKTTTGSTRRPTCTVPASSASTCRSGA
jgi:hypothetical protein